jgi:hypothetical protein
MGKYVFKEIMRNNLVYCVFNLKITSLNYENIKYKLWKLFKYDIYKV